jgi:hypothetical protein
MKAQQEPIHKLLGQKLNLKRAQVYKLAKEIADTLSIKTSDGMLVLAAQQRINLHKYGVAAAEVDRIRGLVRHVPAPSQPIAASSEATAKNRKLNSVRKKNAFKVKVHRSEQIDPLLSNAKLNEMKAMVQVYEILYHLENSIREFISRVLTAKQGSGWWQNIALPRTPREKVSTRTRDDEINAWHQKRSSREIDYLDLNELPALVRAAQTDFVPAFFESIEWFQQLISELYRSRCVVCHMNPLTQNNVDAVGVRFNHWQNLVKAKLAQLEQLEAQAASQPPVQAVAPAAPAVSIPPVPAQPLPGQ